MTAAINAGRALGALLLLTFGLALAMAEPALGDAPAPVIAEPAQGSWTHVQSPRFSGTSNDEGDPLSVNIYAGATAEGVAVQTLQTLLAPLGAWELEAGQPLKPGIYTAVAEQTNGEGETGLSPPVTFTIDTLAPSPTLQSPGGLIADSAPLLKGTAGIEPGDLPAISVVLHHGVSLAGSPASEATVEAHGGEWSAKLGALPDGIYTAQVSQSDEAGNVGVSETVTFTIDTTAPVPAISSPSYGSLLTAARPEFAGTAGVAPGDLPSVTVDISAVGPGRSEKLVETLGPLTVKGGSWESGATGAELPDGLYSAVPRQSDQAGNTGAGEAVLFVVESHPALKGETIAPTVQETPSPAPTTTPSAPVVQWLQPFPVVRIAGSETAGGARITLLNVTAPVGARVTVSCRGGGCPIRSEGVLAGAGKLTTAGTQVIAFRRFQRALRAGVTLEIRVSRAGQIGKFVRFVIRHGKLPTRQDSCLDPTTARPIACPRS